MAEYPYTYDDLGRMMRGRLECLGGNLYGYVASTNSHELILTHDDDVPDLYTLTACPFPSYAIDHDPVLDDAIFEYLYADEAAAMIREYVR